MDVPWDYFLDIQLVTYFTFPFLVFSLLFRSLSMCLSPLCSTSLFYWYLFLCALPHSFSYSCVHLLHPIFCSQSLLSALHQKGWELWTPQRRISEQLQISHSSEAAPSQPSDTSNSPGRTEYLLNSNRSSNKPSVTDLLNQKPSSDQGTERGKAFTALPFYPEVPAEEAPQEVPSTSQTQLVLHQLCSNPSAPQVLAVFLRHKELA